MSKFFYQYQTGAKIDAHSETLTEAAKNISNNLETAYEIIKNDQKDIKPVEIKVEILTDRNELKATAVLFDNGAVRVFYPAPKKPDKEVYLLFMCARWELHLYENGRATDFVKTPEFANGTELVEFINDNKIRVINKHAFRYPEQFDY